MMEEPTIGEKYWLPALALKTAVKIPRSSVFSAENAEGSVFDQGKLAYYPVVLDKIEGAKHDQGMFR
tara:strand:+ start:89 stop:289 length:201 start_codon:yes stop_codon:yes gene_type:complete